MIIWSDIDGVLTSNKKTWLEIPFGTLGNLAYIGKQFSDKDSYVLERIKDKVILVSGDQKINRNWAKYRDVRFLYAPGYRDKMPSIIKYCKENNIDLGKEKMAYIGDGMPDFHCLLEAEYAFIPNDSSLLLVRKLQRVGKKFHKTQRNGGEGVLEEVIVWLQENDFLDFDF